MFEPMMQLSDSFRFVIDNMPCCEVDDADIEEYIYNFIFEYFGFTYIANLLLGGIAQENIIIDRNAHEEMINQGINTVHQAKVSFELKFGIKSSTYLENSENMTIYNSFTNQISSSHATTLGGDPVFTTIPDWSKTVSSSPVIVQFAVRDIFRLLTSHYFPTDPLISNKSALIKTTLDKYLSSIPHYCYGDCGGNNGSHGTCVSSGHFGFGECQCEPEWSSPDCTVPVIKNKILHGTICGFDRSFIKISCEGLLPFSQGCPPGWIQKYWNTDLTICYKNGTSAAKSVVGTLCGLYVIYDSPKYESHLQCNGAPLSDATSYICPPSYQKITARKEPRPYRNSVCASFNAEEDLPGTICGMQIEGTVDGPTCDGHNPGLRQCPSGYTVHLTMFNTIGYLVCAKI